MRAVEAPGLRSAVGVAVLCPSVEPSVEPSVAINQPWTKSRVAGLLGSHGKHGALDVFLGTPVLTGAWGRAGIRFPSLPY